MTVRRKPIHPAPGVVVYLSGARLLLRDCHRDSGLCVRLLNPTCDLEALTHLHTSYAIHTTIDTAIDYLAPQTSPQRSKSRHVSQSIAELVLTKFIKALLEAVQGLGIERRNSLLHWKNE